MCADALIERTKRAFEAFPSGDPSVLAAELADDAEWIFLTCADARIVHLQLFGAADVVR